MKKNASNFEIVKYAYPTLDVLNDNFLNNCIRVTQPFTIYWFNVPQVPNAWKVGETSRGASIRCNEWKHHYHDLYNFDSINMEYKGKILSDDEVRRIINEEEREFGFTAIKSDDLKELGLYPSDEFMKSTVTDTSEKMRELMEKIFNNFKNQVDTNVGTYHILNREDKSSSSTGEYDGNDNYEPLKHQQKAIDNYLELIKCHEKGEFLMKMCPRSGKTFTALECALRSKAKSIVVISSFSSVGEEWKKQVQTHEHTKNVYTCITDTDIVIKENQDLIKEVLNPKYEGDKGFVYITTSKNLLENPDLKDAHKVFKNKTVDLILADEVHYGIKSKRHYSVLNKVLRFKHLIGLSGTPYKIMLNESIPPENIIIDYDFEDLYKDKYNQSGEKSTESNFYTFVPDCLILATKLPKTILDVANYEESGYFLELFRVDPKTGKLAHAKDVLDLFLVMDGSVKDKESFSIFDNPRLQEACMTKHVLAFLPTKAAVTAVINLIKDNIKKFKHLQNYVLLAATGEDEKKAVVIKNTIASVDKQIREGRAVVDGDSSFEEGKCEGTITFTVKKMGTGVTVREWNIGIFLKDGHSAQEYDQFRSRILTPYYDEYSYEEDGEKKVKKVGRKDQVYFFDYYPDRALTVINDDVCCKLLNKKCSKKSYEEILEETLKYRHLIFCENGKLYEQNVNSFNSEFTASLLRKGLLTVNNRIMIDDDCFDSTLLRDERFIACLDTVKLPKEEGKLVYNALTPKDKDDSTPSVGVKEETIINSNAPTNNEPSKKKEEPKDDREVQLLLARKKYKAIIRGLIKYAYFTKSSVKTIDELINSINSNKRNRDIFNNLELDLKVKTIVKLKKRLEDNYAYSMLENISVNLQHAQRIRDLHNEKENKLEACEEFIKWYGYEIDESTFVTPSNTCDDIVDFALKDLNARNKKFFIFDTSGEYLISLLKKGVDFNKNKFFIIPKVRQCINILRRVCELMGISSKCIANFTWKDVLEKFESIEEFGKSLLKFKTKKCFSSVTLDEIRDYKGNEEMTFDVVVGNPPYQGKKKNGDYISCYHKFWDLSMAIAKRVVLITPARFLNNAGSTSKDFNKRWLENPHTTIRRNHLNSKEVFGSNVDIRGDLCICEYDEEKEFGKKEVLSPEAKRILDKVMEKYDSNIEQIEVNSMNKLKLLTLYEDYPEFNLGKNKDSIITTNCVEKYTTPDGRSCFHNTKEEGDIPILAVNKDRKRFTTYISKKYVDPNHPNLWKKSVVVPASGCKEQLNCGKAISIIGKTEIKKVGTGYTETFLGIGSFDTDTEVENCLKYVKSKFCRFMIGLKKVTHHCYKRVWEYVPNQDFTNESDIDWTKSIHEIDEQLYKKYGLDAEDIDFIEQNIREMV